MLVMIITGIAMSPEDFSRCSHYQGYPKNQERLLAGL